MVARPSFHFDWTTVVRIVSVVYDLTVHESILPLRLTYQTFFFQNFRRKLHQPAASSITTKISPPYSQCRHFMPNTTRLHVFTQDHRQKIIMFNTDR